jgi:hypothetical protein
MATLAITTSDELRQVDHRAVIAWERAMREAQRPAAPSTRPYRATKREELDASNRAADLLVSGLFRAGSDKSA